MIYDGGVDRTNFDSSGLSTGYQESLLMTDIEGEILSLIKGQFEGVKDRDVSELGSDWQAEQLRQAESLKKRFVAAFANRQALIMQGIKTSITNGFFVGVQTSKRELSVVGFDYPDREYNLVEAKQGENTILNSFNSVLQAEAQAVSFALGAFVSGVGMIAAATSGKVSQVYDNTVVPELEKGLVGKVTANGAHLELSSYVEGVTRETSQQALLMGESVVANAAGQHLVRISSHQSCCPKCQPYQGQILIDDVFADGKPDGVHELLSTAIANGLFHWNCRHKKTIWIPGKTTEQEQHKQYDDKKVAKNYEIEQAQRALEREIRKQKNIASTSLDPNTASKAQARQAELQARLNALIKEGRAKGYAVYRQPHKEAAGFEFDNKLPYGYANNSLDLVREAQYNNNEYVEMEFNIQLFAKQKDAKKVSNLVARNWYVDHVRNIKNEIDQSLPIEEKARIAFQMRNDIRTQTRDMMEDVELRNRLDEQHPNSSFEELVASKMFRKNMTRAQAIQDIYETSTKTNKNINKMFGIE